MDAKDITSDNEAGEKILTITKGDGQDVTLRGDLADNALAILRLRS